MLFGTQILTFRGRLISQLSRQKEVTQTLRESHTDFLSPIPRKLTFQNLWRLVHGNKLREFSFLSCVWTVLLVDMATADTKDMVLPVSAIKAYGVVELAIRRLPNLDTRLRLVVTFTEQQLPILFDYYKNSRHELLESCLKQVIRESARLSAWIINRILYTPKKLKKKKYKRRKNPVFGK